LERAGEGGVGEAVADVGRGDGSGDLDEVGYTAFLRANSSPEKKQPRSRHKKT